METTQPITKTSRTIAVILLIALITALSSEFKIFPFEDEPFRFGLGSITFFFALIIGPLPLLLTGIPAGIIVVVFRAFLSFICFKCFVARTVTPSLPMPRYLFLQLV